MTFHDVAYAIGLGVAAPYWLVAPKARRKVLRAMEQRMGTAASRDTREPAVMIHAVSMGELNATPALVRRLSDARPDLRFIISTTTDTGSARAAELYGRNAKVTLIRYPLDFSSAVRSVLDRLKPSLVVLMELEVWPNFVRECNRRGIPVLLVNGRLTLGSFRGYRAVRLLLGGMFAKLAAVCVQEEAYANRFARLGARAERIRVTGTMKFDTADIADRIDGDRQLAESVGLRPGVEPIWVCGSTGPGEEQIVLDAYGKVLERHPTLRLVIVPRHDYRWDDAAGLIRRAGYRLLRRSRVKQNPADTQIEEDVPNAARPVVVLGDSMGELRKFYSVADVVFVGRTLVDLGRSQHGSDMIEPAALAKPVVVGPFTGNFSEVMNRFREARAIREVQTGEELLEAIESLLSDRSAAMEMSHRAQDVVRQRRGATARHAEIILEHLEKVAAGY